MGGKIKMALSSCTKLGTLQRFNLSLQSCLYQMQSKIPDICKDRHYATGSDIPDHPKKPPSPFIKLFSQMSRNNRNKTLGDQQNIAKLASEKYRSMDPAEKMRRMAEYQEDLAKYQVQKQIFWSSLSEEQRAHLIEQERSKRTKRANNKKAKVIKELNETHCKPKKSETSGFFVFQKSRFADVGKQSKTLKESQLLVKENARRWNSLPQDEKEMYNEIAADNRAQYDKDLRLWEEQMLAKGHPEVVRKSSIPKSLRKKVKTTL